MSFIPFIPTNRHDVYHGKIVGRQHVKASSGTRKTGQIVKIPGGMDMGRTYPGQTIEYTEPWSTPEAWYVQLQRPSDRKKGWVEVDYATYRLPKGTYLDLRRPYVEPEPSRPAQPAPPAHIRCFVEDIAFDPNASPKERELWDWLSLEIKQELEKRTGNHTLRITGCYIPHLSPDRTRYWGTTVVAVKFRAENEGETEFVAGFISPRDHPELIQVSHQEANFSELRYQGIPRTIELIVTELGL